MAEGNHAFPYRTRPLSPPAPMVLGPQGPGRVGRRQARITCRRLLRQVFCAFVSFGIGDSLHPKAHGRRFSPTRESVRTLRSKQFDDVGPALEVGSDADRDEQASKPTHTLCGMDIAKQRLSLTPTTCQLNTLTPSPKSAPPTFGLQNP
jgi:hypothetical protein